MSKKGQESLTRSNKRRKKTKSKMDRLLNILIAVVSILIILNLVIVLNDDSEKEEKTEVAQENKNNSSDNMKENEDTNQTDNNSSDKDDDGEALEGDSSQSEDNQDSTESDSGKAEDDKETSEAKLIVQSSNDPIVEQVITNPSWDVTPTKQSGEHVSAYEEGHIDYEEKLKTIRNAVQLDGNNIIYWSVKNNGSADSSVAVVSNNDKTEKYRVYIEWVQNEGWKPVKVEKLKKLEGTY
ncbi:YrrS family protein [Ureibacillus sp. 179-F W5.1 NHS]|uniref:YrrS family protein n=1 Tax=Ureibacillus sp. 179-F W5.1 NHS TaxID=3374297 RepID=UPI003879DB30